MDIQHHKAYAPLRPVQYISIIIKSVLKEVKKSAMNFCFPGSLILISLKISETLSRALEASRYYHYNCDNERLCTRCNSCFIQIVLELTVFL